MIYCWFLIILERILKRKKEIFVHKVNHTKAKSTISSTSEHVVVIVVEDGNVGPLLSHK